MKIRKWKVESECKQVVFFPIVKKDKKTGKKEKMRFGRLKFICLKMSIGNGQTSLTLGCSFAKGLDYPVYTIQHEPNPISLKPGMRERIDDTKEFSKRVAKFAGEDSVKEIVGTFHCVAEELSEE